MEVIVIYSCGVDEEWWYEAADDANVIEGGAEGDRNREAYSLGLLGLLGRVARAVAWFVRGGHATSLVRGAALRLPPGALGRARRSR
jgi:hypothetical protein